MISPGIKSSSASASARCSSGIQIRPSTIVTLCVTVATSSLESLPTQRWREESERLLKRVTIATLALPIIGIIVDAIF